MLFFENSDAPYYGLINNLLPAPFSALISIILIIGIDFFGLLILKHFFYFNNKIKFRWLRFQAVCIGTAVLATFLYPLALFGYLSRLNAKFIALFFLVMGLYHAVNLIQNHYRQLISISFLKRYQEKKNFYQNFLYLILLLYLFLSIGPVTDADSLDYHVGVALYIINTGNFPFTPEWFHSRLAGSGEVLIAFGLSVGAECFGSLLQYAGILSIYGIFRYCFKALKSWRYLCIISILTSPVLIALTMSQKPMLLPIAMTTLALVICLKILYSNHALDSQYQWKFFSLICLLVMSASVIKLNFLVSGFIVGFFAFFLMVINNHLRTALIIFLLSFLLIFFPQLIWKYINYGGNLFTNFISPFPGSWVGTDLFETMLVEHRENEILFPFSLIIPHSLGSITTVIGFGVLFVILFIFRISSKIGITIILIALILSFLYYIFGQKSSRFFLEPYLWFMMAILIHGKLRFDVLNKFLFVGVIAQSFLILGILIFGILTISVGAYSDKLRDSVMKAHSMSYSEMVWADKILPTDAKVLIYSRFMATVPRYAIASDWRGYVPTNDERKVFYEKITETKMPDFVIFSTPPNVMPVMDRCNGFIYAGPFRSHVATRNPWNSGSPYDVYIIKLLYPGAICIF